ncbi:MULTISPECIES: hypothetical protein [unclassified Rhodococcus (in: high G+C Gram-positive bacteria)]|uniref:hypothetical protein n=1 Tax=unclassified Rhodococcus (in: high G+C Gram-positive bacteria) TaxID=192944 RepID=UPI000B9BD8AE|nr:MULTISPECIES: hypothetical protein [unclassified Rhodococcus (in: high G+C Gram-positive bacteria)]OZE35623.1 hypothetical protein CH259_16485 [Rhodococcus sp. 05-2254-4]OZE48052.1 hypothetical protein CH261_09080 [Rhodococcus sp. 05-2254-3]OZE49263.1 hypothetical protein CH283_16865 [Rhodococcus sp. 05-2254-2]
MPEVFNPVSVEAAIRECANRIANGVTECNRRYVAFLEADHALDIAYARAWAADSGPANGKRYTCELATIDLRKARDVADAMYRHADRQAKALESELRAWQSVNKSVMGAYQTAGTGER